METEKGRACFYKQKQVILIYFVKCFSTGENGLLQTFPETAHLVKTHFSLENGECILTTSALGQFARKPCEVKPPQSIMYRVISPHTSPFLILFHLTQLAINTSNYKLTANQHN